MHSNKSNRVRGPSEVLAAAAVAALVAVPADAAAQSGGPVASYQLPEMVVTATRTEQRLERVGSAISVITAEDIERNQLRNLDEVLLRLPGVNLPPRSAGAASGVMLRGLGPRNTLFLLDGVEIGDVSEAQVQYTLRNQIDVRDIERVEVLRGPQSSVYGADATGGVINIITRTARRPFGGTAYAEAGSHGYLRGGGSVETVQGDLDARLSGFYYSEDGYSTAKGGSEDDAQGAEGVHLGLGYDAGRTLRLIADLKATQINQHYDSVDGVYDASFNRIGNVPGEERNDVTKMEYFARLGAEHRAFDGRLESRLDYSFARNERDFAYYDAYSDPNAFIDSYDGTKHKLGYLGTVDVAPDHEITLGAETEYSELSQNTPAVSSTPIVEEHTRNDALFLGYAGTFFDDLTISLSGRIDDDQDFGTEATWRTAAAYLIRETGTKLRASYGTGFVAPSLYERFDPCIGNANLDPETSEGFDFGVDQSFLKGRARAGITLFHVETRDQIAYRALTTPQNPACSFAGIYANEDRTRSQGVEVEMSAAVGRGVVLTANYTYTDAENLADGSRLRGVPEHRAAADVSWRFIDAASIGFGLEYRSDVTTYTDVGDDIGDQYVLVTARAGYDLTDHVTLYARAENLLDRGYEEMPGYTAPGFAAYGGLQVRF